MARKRKRAGKSDASPENAPQPAKKLKPIRPRFTARLRAYFLAGVLVTAPIAITFYLAWLFISFVDSRVRPLIPPGYNPESYLPFSIPGLGVVIVIIVLTLIGAVTAGYVGRIFVRLSEQMLARMPVIRSVYGATKQIFETVFSNQSRAFREVVLFEYPRRGIWSIGFITGTTQGEVQALTEDEVMNVFLPTTPNPTSGYLLFVPRRELIYLDMTIEEGVKMVVSGGIVTPPRPRPPLERDKRIPPHPQVLDAEPEPEIPEMSK